MQKAELDRWVSRREACRMASVKAPSTLWRWELDGIFPRRRVIGKRRVAYLESELRAWIEQRNAAT